MMGWCLHLVRKEDVGRKTWDDAGKCGCRENWEFGEFGNAGEGTGELGCGSQHWNFVLLHRDLILAERVALWTMCGK